MQQKNRKTREFPDLTKLGDEALVTGRVADGMFGQSKATRYRRINAGTFPQPRKIGPTMARYVLGELRTQARRDAEVQS